MLSWLAYATAVSVLIGATAALAERASVFVGRRFVWVAAMLASAVVPVVPVVAAFATSASASASAGFAGSAAFAGSPAPARSVALPGIDAWIVLGWAAASVLLLVTFGVQALWLARRRATWRRANLDGECVLVSPWTGPAVVGVVRPEIVVPESFFALDATERRMVLLHEREHIAARDAALHVLGAILLIVFPWNPALWWQHRRLHLAVEMDCDGRVLGRGVDTRAYGAVLLRVAGWQRAGLAPRAALIATKSMLMRRILGLVAPRPRRRALLGFALAAAVLVFVASMRAPAVPDAIRGVLTRPSTATFAPESGDAGGSTASRAVFTPDP